MRFTIGAFTIAAMAVVLATLAACPETPKVVPQAQQAAEVPQYPAIADPSRSTEPAVVQTPAAAPEAAASTAKATTPKEGKKIAKPATTGKPKVTEEEYATLAAQFYAEHVKCLGEVLDVKIAGDIRLGEIRDFGNIRESGVCGYDYFEDATGRLPPYPK